MVYVGIDLGGTNIVAGVVDKDGKILGKAETPTMAERPYAEVLKDMGDVVVKAVENAGFTMDDVASVGVGAPGVADPETGDIVFANNLRWYNVPVCSTLKAQLNKPVYINNDANVAGLAEAMFGACKGAKSSITITLGTGLGGGIILNGKIWSGTHGVGAELGHIVIEKDGLQCNCGNHGCWERYSSATALIRWGRMAAVEFPSCLINAMADGDINNITAKTVIDAAKAKDFVAIDVFNKFIGYLADGIVTLINSIDPEVIAIGGGVSKAGEFLLEPLRKLVAEKVMFKDLPYARIELAEMGNDAGIVGAAMLGVIA